MRFLAVIFEGKIDTKAVFETKVFLGAFFARCRPYFEAILASNGCLLAGFLKSKELFGQQNRAQK